MSTTPLDFLKSLGFAYPLSFESDHTSIPVYSGGTCFAVRFRKRLYIVTATHCIAGKEETPLIIGPDKKVFPVKQCYWPSTNEDDNDWADITCITTYDDEHWPALQSKDIIDLDQLITQHLSVAPGDYIGVTGYSTDDTDIELDPFRIIRKQSAHLGVYGGPTNDKHCHFFSNWVPPISNPDGLSGSPVFIVKQTSPSIFHPALLGVVVRGGKGHQFLRFVGVDVVIRMLLKLSATPNI